MKKFLKTVAIVTVFAAFERLLGFLYRIYLSRTLGSEGMGIYQIVLTVFAAFLTFSSSGIPVTVSRLMTKYRAENNEKKVASVMTAGFVTAALSAAAVVVIFLSLKSVLAPRLFTDERCLPVLNILLPTLILCSCYMVMRGVLWGNKNFLPYSMVDLAEEIIMIVIGIILISKATSLFSALKRAGLAVAVSYGCSFIMMTAYFVIKKTKLANPLPQTKTLIKSSTPITVMRAANSIINSLVAVLLPLMLVKSGMTAEAAISEFGSAYGMAMPLLFIPSTLINGFTVVLIPEVAENFYNKRYLSLKADMEKAFKFSMLITCVFLPVFAVLGEQIGVFVYGDYASGKYISIASLMMIPMAFSMISTSILNSLGEEKRTLLYFVLSAILMILAIVILPKYLGIYSLLVGNAATFLITAILNLRLIYKKNKEKPSFLKASLIMLLCTVPTIIFGYLLKGILMRALSTTLTLFIAAMAMVAFNCLLLYVANVFDVKGMLKKIKQT